MIAADWIPIDAAVGGRVPAVVGDVLEAWSKHWFGRSRPLIARLKPVPAGLKRPADGGWRVYRETVGLSVSARAAQRLLSYALDAPIDHLSITQADRQVLDQVEHVLLEDLAAQFETAFGGLGDRRDPFILSDNPFGPHGGVEVIASEELGGDLLSISLPLSKVVRVALPLDKSVKPTALASFHDALAPTTVVLEATLGKSAITLAELKALAPGDVLVLDARLGQAVEISLAGASHPFARAKLDEVDGQVSLVF